MALRDAWRRPSARRPPCDTLPKARPPESSPVSEPAVPLNSQAESLLKPGESAWRKPRETHPAERLPIPAGGARADPGQPRAEGTVPRGLAAPLATKASRSLVPWLQRRDDWAILAWILTAFCIFFMAGK